MDYLYTWASCRMHGFCWTRVLVISFSTDWLDIEPTPSDLKLQPINRRSFHLINPIQLARPIYVRRHSPAWTSNPGKCRVAYPSRKKVSTKISNSSNGFCVFFGLRASDRTRNAEPVEGSAPSGESGKPTNNAVPRKFLYMYAISMLSCTVPF